jgi:hypothetical protein
MRMIVVVGSVVVQIALIGSVLTISRTGRKIQILREVRARRLGWFGEAISRRGIVVAVMRIVVLLGGNIARKANLIIGGILISVII